MGIEDYVVVAKNISFELLDRIENRFLVEYNAASLSVSKITAVQQAYENWIKAIIIGELIPSLWNFNKLASNISPALNILNTRKDAIEQLDPNIQALIATTQPLMNSQSFLQSYQSTFEDETLKELILKSDKNAINNFLKLKLNHNLRWFFDYASNMQMLDSLLPPALDENGNATERGHIYAELTKEVDATKPCLMCIHKNPKFKQVIDLLKQEPAKLNIDLPLTMGPDIQNLLNSLSRHTFALLYATLIVKCLNKYQNEPRYSSSEDSNISEESKYLPVAVEILKNNYKDNKLFIDKLIPELVSYFEHKFPDPYNLQLVH